METRTYSAPDIECDGCANAIKRALANVQGIANVNVDVNAKTVEVTRQSGITDETVIAALDRAGFPATPVEA